MVIAIGGVISAVPQYSSQSNYRIGRTSTPPLFGGVEVNHWFVPIIIGKMEKKRRFAGALFLYELFQYSNFFINSTNMVVGLGNE